MLGFEGEAGIGGVLLAVVALLVQALAGVELDARLVAHDCHDAAGSGIFRFRQFTQAFAGDAVVQVVAVRVLQRVALSLLGESVADAQAGAQVQRGAGDADDAASGDQFVVRLGRFIGVYGDDVVEDIAFAREIEIGVVGQVDDRILVAVRKVADGQGVAVIERHGHLNAHLAGEAFLAVVGDVGEQHRVFGFAFQRFCLEPFELEVFNAAMQAVFPVVGGYVIDLAVQRELRVAQAVGEAADGRADAAVRSEIRRELVKTEIDFGEFPVTVGHNNTDDVRAEIRDRDGGAGRVGHGEKGHRAPVRILAEGLRGDAHENRPPLCAFAVDVIVADV